VKLGQVRRSDAIGIAAADWALRHEQGALGAAEEQRFADWLAADPGHVAAYEDAVWALEATARHAGAGELLDLRRAALMARGSRPMHRWRWAGGAGLAATLAIGGATWIATPRPTPSVAMHVDPPSAPRLAKAAPPRLPARRGGGHYRTGIGERSSITLPDGSVATLDSDSAMDVAFTARERGVHLMRGQALFTVAHGRPLPFRVYARDDRITAVGTAFNVRIDGAAVKVAMVQGRVHVRVGPAASDSAVDDATDLVLVAGETLRTGDAAQPMVGRVDTARVASWTSGLLVFDDTRLADAVAEINRYTTRPIAIADAAVGDYRISGVFRSNDPDRFARACADIFPVEVARTPGGAVALRMREN